MPERVEREGQPRRFRRRLPRRAGPWSTSARRSERRSDARLFARDVSVARRGAPVLRDARRQREGDHNLPERGIGPFRAIAASELGNARVAPNARGRLAPSPPRRSRPRPRRRSGDARGVGLLRRQRGEPRRRAGLARAARRDRPLRRARRSLLRSRRTSRCSRPPSRGKAGRWARLRCCARADGSALLRGERRDWRGLGERRRRDVHARSRGRCSLPTRAGGKRARRRRARASSCCPTGSFRMFYEVATGGGATSLGEARSVRRRRVDARRRRPGPRAFSARRPERARRALTTISPSARPSPMTGTTEEGTPVVRVYYGARDSAGGAGIGLAGRFGDDGPLVRAALAGLRRRARRSRRASRGCSRPAAIAALRDRARRPDAAGRLRRRRRGRHAGADHAPAADAEVSVLPRMRDRLVTAA